MKLRMNECSLYSYRNIYILQYRVEKGKLKSSSKFFSIKVSSISNELETSYLGNYLYGKGLKY